MSAVEFFSEGSSGGHFATWDVNRADVTEVELLPGKESISIATSQSTAIRPLDQRVKAIPSASQDRAIHSIDNLIKLTTLSPAKREEKQKFWESQQTTMNRTFWVGGVCGTAGAVIPAILQLVHPAVGLLSIPTFLVGWRSKARSADAKKQLEGWKSDLIAQTACLRTMAFDQGFPYVMQYNLKGVTEGASRTGVLHLSEVQELYRRFLEDWCNRLTRAAQLDEKARSRLAREFAKSNPLSLEAINFAELDQSKQDLLQSYVENFNTYKHDIDHFQKQYLAKKKETIAIEKSKVEEVERNRTLALIPLSVAYTYYIDKARKEKEATLARESPEGITREQHRKNAEDAYNSAVTKYNLLFAGAKLPLHHFFNSQVKAINEQKSKFLHQLEQMHNHALLPFFDNARVLIVHAREAYQTGKKPPTTAAVYHSPFSASVELPQFTPPPSGNWTDTILRSKISGAPKTDDLRALVGDAARDQELSSLIAQKTQAALGGK
ncbi:MAG: hypothetical protein HYZ47_01815 [Simkania negevensis]|nr:hypothetical protein [Simkania negevensis]